MGYKYIETDLRMTLDREVIAFHDPDLKRLFKLDLQVKDLTFKEIANLFREKNCSLLTLEDALKRFPDIYFNIVHPVFFHQCSSMLVMFIDVRQCSSIFMTCSVPVNLNRIDQ